MACKPQLRFREFTDEWEEKNLGEISEITMGQSPSSKNYTENSKDTILIQGNADLVNGEIVPRIYTTEVTKKSKPNDIIMTIRAPVGDLAINKYHVCIGRGVCAIEASDFIYQLLKYFKLKNEWVKFSQGSTFESINSKDIKNFQFKIPSLKEQEKIAKFLTSIDEKINQISIELEKTKQYKKGLLQKMFV